MANLKDYISGLSTVQIAAIAVAVVLVLILVVVLVVRRNRRDGDGDLDYEDFPEEPSMDGPPHNELQQPGRPGGIATTDIAPTSAAPPDVAPTDIAPPAVVPAATPEPPLAPPLTAAAAVADIDVTSVAAALAALTDAPAPQPAKRMVPLSDIIVTTSSKMVDLEDPEVRRMLKDLASYEIDQAAHFRQLGQDLDAVLQLTEAEKICRALGMATYARQIHEMMRGLQT